MDFAALSLIATGLLIWVAIVHFVLAFGVRRGELVWSGRYPRILTPELRRRSFFYAVSLLLSGWVIAAFGGVIDIAPVSEKWLRSAGWVVTVFLALGAGYCILRGSRWERLFFAPITLFGAVLAGWLTFV